MDPFATLGLPRRFDLDREQLERQYRDLQRTLHPDRHTGAPASERRMKLSKAVEVNEAYRRLRNELTRAEALVSLENPQEAGEEPPADPDFLMEVMELREGLGEAKASRNLRRVRKLAEEVKRLQGDSRAALTVGFGRPDDVTARDWEAIRMHVGRLRYYARFLDEVAVIEDEQP